MESIRRNRLTDNYSTNIKSAVKRYSECARFCGHTPFPVTYDPLSDWVALGVSRQKKLAACITDQRNLRAYCTHERIEYLANGDDAMKFKEFIDGCKVLDSGEVKRPRPLTMAALNRMHGIVDFKDPIQRQIWLILLMSHHLFLRGGDACSYHIRREHVHFKSHGRLKVVLVKRKDNRRGGPRPVWAHPSSDPHFDLPRLLREYLHTAGITADDDNVPLFARIDENGRLMWPLQPLSYTTWRNIFGDWTTAAGLTNMTPHAARAGGLTDAIAGGADPFVAAKAGGWAPLGCWPLYLRMQPTEAGLMLNNSFESQLATARGTTESSSSHVKRKSELLQLLRNLQLGRQNKKRKTKKKKKERK